MHDGTFKDVAGELGVANVNQLGTGVSTGAVWGDYDNDGYEDLFHNDHGHGFSEQAGLPPWINANTAIWFDYDGDGLLDLFVGGYYVEDIDLWHLTTTRIMPDYNARRYPQGQMRATDSPQGTLGCARRRSADNRRL